MLYLVDKEVSDRMMEDEPQQYKLCIRMCSRRLARAEDHSGCLFDVGLQAHSFEQPYQGAEISLEPSWVWWLDHASIHVEEVILVPDLFSTPAPLFCALCHHWDPVMYHRIHHHVEDGGG